MLIASYGPDVLATCIAMVRDRAAAEDVTQEVFSDALRALPTFRGESSPRTWLLSIARNRCIDYLRARKRDPWKGARGEGSDPDAQADQGAFEPEWFADRSVIQRALDALAEGDRALIVLRFKNGLDYGELATAFGLREGTVRMRVSRALARMREVLSAEEAPTLTRAAVSSVGPASTHLPPPAPAQEAVRARSGATVEGARAWMALGAARHPPTSPAPDSWWSRFKSLIGSRRVNEPTASPPPSSTPVGALGLALAACEPSTPSEALTARLARLVEDLPARA